MTQTIPAPPSTAASVVAHTIGIERVTDELRSTQPRLLAEHMFAVVERFGPLVAILATDSTSADQARVARRAVAIAKERGAVLVEPCAYCGVTNCADPDRHTDWDRASETTVRERWSSR
jgi:hypothetical protein